MSVYADGGNPDRGVAQGRGGELGWGESAVDQKVDRERKGTG